MKKLLGFICVLLIAVFAVMPNTYAETQKDYGNLDMNRWFALGETDEYDILIDMKSMNYQLNYKKDLVCDFWVCYFYNNEDKYVLSNMITNYDEKTISLRGIAIYNKNNESQGSNSLPFPKEERIIPGSIGEFLYSVSFPPEYMNADSVQKIKENLKEKI